VIGLRVTIWRDVWLPTSETFVAGQVATYRSVTPVTACIIRARARLSEPDVVVGTAARALALGGARTERLLAAQIARRLRPRAIDIVHSHFGPDSVKMAGVAGALDVPLAVTFHGYDVSATREPYLARYFATHLPRLLNRTDAVIAVSRFVADRLVKLGARPERVHVHHIGVSVPPADQLAAERRHVLFVGRLVEKKGADDLLTAFSKLPVALRRTPLTIVGEGPLRQQLQARARDLELDVTFTGSVSRREVAGLMSAAICACVPSRRARNGDCEGLPTVAVEAGAWSVPVIASDHAGIRDAVLDGETGLLHPESDTGALAECLEALLDDPGAAASMGHAARQRVAAHFEIGAQTAKLEQIYAALRRCE
jgi:glycosyltransferase involved in cell wall biosynthesis